VDPGLQHLKLTVEAEGRIALLEFDHGKANEMGRDQIAELERLVQAIEDDSRVGALVTYSRRRSSKGTRLFVAGANVVERQEWTESDVKTHVRWQRRVLTALRNAPVFHVAVVDGVALGWGTEYLLTCDWRIACDGAVFGLPETGLGILPGAGGTSDLWAEIGVAQTLRLGMTGERIDADEAYRIGLVQERRPNVDAGLDRARQLAALVSHRSPTAIATFKQAVLWNVGQSDELRHEREARAYEHCVDVGESAFGRAHFERVRQGGVVPWAPRKPQRR
jgi:enoyl-CoA hydratase/carnithine racemase